MYYTEKATGLLSLASAIQEFEGMAHLEIQLRWKTDGSVELAIKDLDSDMKQTQKFRTVRQAVEWVRDQI